MSKLVLTCHGQNEWNLFNQFTDWANVNLSERGVEEAKKADRLVKERGPEFDQAYTLLLTRAIKTSHYALEESDQLRIPETKAWRLDERHYDALQGLDKEVTAEKHDDEQAYIWRHSYDVLPPAIDNDNEFSQAHDRCCTNLDPHIAPRAENSHVCLDYVIPLWEDHITLGSPDGKNVIIAVYGNSLRALAKYIENISDDDTMSLEMKAGEPVVYTFDDKSDVVNKGKLDD